VVTIDATSRVHPTAIVEDGASVGPGTQVWHHSHVRAGAVVGAECNLGKNVYVDEGASIGDRVKVQNNVSVYRGVVLHDEVFVGPSAVFTNDLFPRAQSASWDVVRTVVERGASVGANATVVCGVTLGAWSMVGAGSVVTHDVPANALVIGNPARLHGWVCSCGHLIAKGPDFPSTTCPRCGTKWEAR
jgi:UDP-2-acetamido-3-amino-2,3-dideoxy-glucuronate N-acetyltransferase